MAFENLQKNKKPKKILYNANTETHYSVKSIWWPITVNNDTTDNTNKELSKKKKNTKKNETRLFFMFFFSPDKIKITHQGKRHGTIMKENYLKHQDTSRHSKVSLSPLKENHPLLRTSALSICVNVNSP